MCSLYIEANWKALRVAAPLDADKGALSGGRASEHAAAAAAATLISDRRAPALFFPLPLSTRSRSLSPRRGRSSDAIV